MISLLKYSSEKGKDPWPRDREPVLKKLKTAEAKVASPRTTAASTHAHNGSVVESVSPSESSESESEDESDYYSESEEVPEPEEPSPLPSNRPADPNKAIEYDVIKAVWAKKNVGLSGTVIRTALGEYWNIFKTIRDKWKSKTTSLQQAIEKKDQGSIKAYERRVVESRRLLESCINLTLKHGHPDIIEKYVCFLFSILYALHILPKNLYLAWLSDVGSGRVGPRRAIGRFNVFMDGTLWAGCPRPNRPSMGSAFCPMPNDA